MTTERGDINEVYYYERFTLQHFEAMKTLFVSAFGTILTDTNFTKRYDTASLGHPVVGYLAFHKESGSPAAYYGVFPLKLIYQNKALLSAQSGDTMTHAEHRKKGLFVSLARLTFQTCQTEGIKLIFGLPNKNSYPGFINHLKWQQIDIVSRYDLKLRIKTFPTPKLMAKLGLFKTYLKLSKRVVGKKIVSKSEFNNKWSDSKLARVSKNQDYLAYKEDLSTCFIEIEGVVFWVKFTDVFWIGDISNYSMVDNIMISKLRRLAFLLGYNTISFHLNDSLARPQFLQYFKKYNEEPLCVYYFDNEYQGINILITGADFDTW